MKFVGIAQRLDIFDVDFEMSTEPSTLVLIFVLFLAENEYQHRHSGAGRNPVFTRVVASSGCRIKPGMMRIQC